MLKRAFAVAALVSACACASKPYSARVFAGTLEFLYTQQAPLGPQEIRGDSHARYWDPLVAFAARRNVDVITLTFPNPTQKGGFSALHRLIGISEQLSPNEQVATLVHELGHVLSPGGLSRMNEDVFAEGVAVIVMKRLGLDIRMESAGYFLDGASICACAPMRTLAPKIDAAAALILKEIQ